MNNLKTYIFFLAFLISALYLIKIFDIAYPLTIVSTTKTSELAVVGEAKIDVSPDTAYVNLGVLTQAPTVAQVREKIDRVNSSLMEELKKLKINQNQIKTTNYSIYPNYDYNNGQKIIGYSGTINLQVKLKDFQLISKVLEKAESAGVNQIGGVSFTIDQPEVYREKVREKAIENAKSQAQKLAKSLKIKLGKITNIVEATPQEPILLRKPVEMGAGGASTQIEPGMETISTTVTLYFEKK